MCKRRGSPFLEAAEASKKGSTAILSIIKAAQCAPSIHSSTYSTSYIARERCMVTDLIHSLLSSYSSDVKDSFTASSFVPPKPPNVSSVLDQNVRTNGKQTISH
ncbi:hypothetical protein PsorP6_001650 [Peronosclerospora sorghi]|uniref:Uncharacterized protein n=1 Tax=Peronosclerospora sorghi TaxID=230839 RepID=A0ACC0WW60_9STRA|nr:hypothetical protein PsorP6_001650 [Peronosclerospora sorghi]